MEIILYLFIVRQRNGKLYHSYQINMECLESDR